MRMILCSTLCLHSTSEIGCEYCPNKLKIAAEDVITTTNLTLTLASIKKTLVNEVKNEYIYKFNLHKKNILEMKHHLIRNWIQDQIKYKILKFY